MAFERSSTYTPFLRRFFTDERQLELEEAGYLYERVRRSQELLAETPDSVGQGVYEFLDDLPTEIRQPFVKALNDLVEAERHIWQLPAPAFERMSLREFVEYRDLLFAKEYFFANREEVLRLLHEGLVRLLYGLARELPECARPTPFTIPLVYALPDPRLSVEQPFGTLQNSGYEERGIFLKLSRQLYVNLCRVSGRDPGDDSSRRPWKYPRQSELPLDRCAEEYLGDTPLAPLFNVQIPLRLGREERFSHMHVVGGSGAGKTSLLENLLLHDLQSPNPPSLVIVDPHGDLINRLSRADLGIADRLVLIDPRDVRHPPALNVFALNRRRMDSYDEATREQVEAGVIQTFDYLFTGLLGADLTAKQGVFFRYVARLMLALPETMGRNATILDMLALMTDPEPYQAAMERLPPIPREFFRRDFPSRTFAQTKEQIRYRLQAILENPTMARLFTSPETKVDLFEELNRGSVILVDTAKDFLKGASPQFGRVFISLVLQAILERAALPERDRRDTFVFVDEAATFFDQNIDDLLTEARKYRCGLVLAHQYLDQASHGLRASLAANTASKFVSGVSAADARALAPELRTTPEFILTQPKLQFASFIRGTTPNAVSIPIEPGVLSRVPQLSADAHRAMLDRNRARVSLPRAEVEPLGERPTTEVAPLPSPRKDEDISAEW